MNAATIRFLWKEYRVHRDLWLLSLISAVALELLLLNLPTGRFFRPSAEGIWIILVFAPVVYVMGVASTMFSREHESGCYEFLRGLPLRARSVWTGKVVYAVLSSAIFVFVLFVATIAILKWHSIDTRSLVAGLNQYRTVEPKLSASQSIGSMLIFVCQFALITVAVGTVCSLLIRRPLWSAFIAGGIVFGLFSASTSIDSSAVVSAGLLLTVACGAASFALTRRWLNCHDAVMTFDWQVASPRIRLPVAWFDRCYIRFRRYVVGLLRTFWLQASLVGWLWVIVVVSFVVGVFCIVNSRNELGIFLRAWPTLLGLATFIGDKSANTYRFHAEQGMRPSTVWAHRQLIGLTFLVGLFLVEVALVERSLAQTINIDFLPMTALLGYAIGQLCSLFSKSVITAAFSVTCLHPLVAIWGMFAASLNIPFWIASVIPSAACLLATFLRTREWLYDQDTLQRWIAIAIPLVLVAPITYLTIWNHRVTEVPLVSLNFDCEATAGERTAISRMVSLRNRVIRIGSYQEREDVDPREAVAINWNELPVPIPNEEAQWLAENEQALSLTLDSDDRIETETITKSTINSKSNPEGYIRFGHLLVAKARRHVRAGEFDKALAAFRTALQYAQDLRNGAAAFDSIRSAWRRSFELERMIYSQLVLFAGSATEEEQLHRIQGLVAEFENNQPQWLDYVRSEYAEQRMAIESIVSTGQWHGIDFRYVHLFPGEIKRSLRLLDYSTYCALRDTPSSNDETNLQLGSLSKSSLLGRFVDLSSVARSESYTAINENQRRATSIIVKLLAWRLQHGKYPETLDELPGADSLPNDVTTNLPFSYIVASARLLNELIDQQSPLSYRRFFMSEPTRKFEINLNRARILYARKHSLSHLETFVFPLPEFGKDQAAP